MLVQKFNKSRDIGKTSKQTVIKNGIFEFREENSAVLLLLQVQVQEG